MATTSRRQRTRAEQRAWNDGYSTGYKAAHGLLQTELRAQYATRRHSPLTRLLAVLRGRGRS